MWLVTLFISVMIIMILQHILVVATEGISPINVGNPCSGNNCFFWLSGLSNETPFYINVAAYDRTEYPEAKCWLNGTDYSGK